MKRKKNSSVEDLNELLKLYNLPEIRDLNEISPSLLVALYESLRGSRLPIRNRKDRSAAGKVWHIKELLKSISQDVLRTDLSHIDPRSVCSRDRRTLLCLVEVLVSIGRILCQSRCEAGEVGDSTIAQSTTDDAASSDSCSETIDNSCAPSSSSSCRTLPRKCCHSLSDTHLTDLSTITTLSCTDSPAVKLRTTKVSQHNRKVFGSPVVRRGTAKWKFARGQARSDKYPSMTNSPRAIVGASKRPYQDSTSSHRCELHMNVNPKTSSALHTNHAITQDPLSFFTDSSPQVTAFKIVAHSPYEKYLKARQGIAARLSAHLLPLEDTPTKYQFRRRKHSSTNQDCNTARKGDWRVQDLMTSVGSSTSSDVSFYED